MKILSNKVMHVFMALIFVVFLSYSFAGVYTAVGYVMLTAKHMVSILFLILFMYFVFVGAYLLEQRCLLNTLLLCLFITISGTVWSDTIQQSITEFGIEDSDSILFLLGMRWGEIFEETFDLQWSEYAFASSLPVMMGVSYLFKASKTWS